MKKLLLSFIVCFSTAITFAQTSTQLPKIMVIPFTKDGEDLRTILDENIDSRIAISHNNRII